MTLRINVVGGLCNRLRALLSARARYGEIDVIWEENDVIAFGHFLDVFEPLDGVRFVDGGWDVEAWAPCPDAPPGWEEWFGRLRPTAAVAERIGWGRPYAAVHIRRTDHLPNMSQLGHAVEPLDTFISWASRFPLLYVATDNGETQKLVHSAREGRTFVATWLDGVEDQSLTDHRRNGTLADAVVDLYMCVAATDFMGSRNSSFSDTITTIRRLRGMT